MLTVVGEEEGNRVEEPPNSVVTEISDHHAQSNGEIQFIWTLNSHLVRGCYYDAQNGMGFLVN